jgi:hypothetical protein
VNGRFENPAISAGTLPLLFIHSRAEGAQVETSFQFQASTLPGKIFFGEHRNRPGQ